MVVEQWQIKVDGTPSIYSLPFIPDDETLPTFRRLAAFSLNQQDSGPTLGRLTYHGVQPDIRLRCSISVPWNEKGHNPEFLEGLKGLKTSTWSSPFHSFIDVTFRNKVTYLTDYEFRVIPKQSADIMIKTSSIGDQIAIPRDGNSIPQENGTKYSIFQNQPSEPSSQPAHKPVIYARRRAKESTNGIGIPSKTKQSSMVAKNGRANHSKESWEEQRGFIEQLYRGHHCTIIQVKEELDKHGFIAT